MCLVLISSAVSTSFGLFWWAYHVFITAAMIKLSVILLDVLTERSMNVAVQTDSSWQAQCCGSMLKTCWLTTLYLSAPIVENLTGYGCRRVFCQYCDLLHVFLGSGVAQGCRDVGMWYVLISVCGSVSAPVLPTVQLQVLDISQISPYSGLCDLWNSLSFLPYVLFCLCRPRHELLPLNLIDAELVSSGFVHCQKSIFFPSVSFIQSSIGSVQQNVWLVTSGSAGEKAHSLPTV